MKIDRVNDYLQNGRTFIFNKNYLKQFKINKLYKLKTGVQLSQKRPKIT